ncbi:MAG: flagellar hook assembly protein FlgD [Planctomycetaceae bacterium]
MAVTGVNSTNSASNTIDPSKTGFSGMTSQDFMKLLIAQLRNQDPLQPTDNEQLLNQITSMRELQSNLELESTLKSITTNQQFASAASLLGQTITGTTSSKEPVTGVVSQIFLKDNSVILGVDDKEVPLANVSTIKAT